MPSAEQIKSHEREAYDSVAVVFASVWGRYTARFASDLIDLLSPQKGESALDVAGGTGASGLRLAERIGAEGRVVIADISPGMLQQAEKDAAARGLTNVTTRPMDAEKLEFADGIFDVITCTFGVMFLPDVRRALAEAYRVLRPGGRIGFAVWSDPFRTPFVTVPAEALIKRVAPAPIRILLRVPGMGKALLKTLLVNRGATGPSGFRFSKLGSLEKHLRATGFRAPRRELRAYPVEFLDFESYWDALVRGSPAGMMMKKIPAEIVEEVKVEVRSSLAHPKTDAVYVHNEAALVLADKPA